MVTRAKIHYMSILSWADTAGSRIGAGWDEVRGRRVASERAGMSLGGDEREGAHYG